MLPEMGNHLQKKFSVREPPSKTFKLDGNRIIGFVDGIEAVKQTVYCILNTERFEWLIYSWNYGIELKNLYGKPIPLVKARIKRRIEEALLQDKRITGVDHFTFETNGRKLKTTFTVHTKLGDFKAEKEVKT